MKILIVKRCVSIFNKAENGDDFNRVEYFLQATVLHL